MGHALPSLLLLLSSKGKREIQGRPCGLMLLYRLVVKEFTAAANTQGAEETDLLTWQVGARNSTRQTPACLRARTLSLFPPNYPSGPSSPMVRLIVTVWLKHVLKKAPGTRVSNSFSELHAASEVAQHSVQRGTQEPQG